MPAKKRNWTKEWEQEQARSKDELPRRAARARARRAYDAEGIDRDGLDVAHKKALSHGGSDKLSNTKLQKPSVNRSFARTSTGKMKRKQS